MLSLEEEKAKFVFKMKVDIRWSDMDEMGHVNNAIYLTYFEQARVYYCQESCEWDWRELGVILANAHLDYVRPVVFPDPTFIYVRTSKIGNKSLVINYMITTLVDGVEQLATTGYTVMVMFDYKSNQSMLVPDSIREKLRKYEKEAL